MKLKFCRKDEGEGVKTEKPTSRVFSKRPRDRKRSGRRKKAAGKKAEDLGVIHF